MNHHALLYNKYSKHLTEPHTYIGHAHPCTVFAALKSVADESSDETAVQLKRS